MKREWKLGDVAMARGLGGEFRPLVVIDPEDRKTFRPALEDFTRRLFGYTATDADCDRFAEALREFANPTPPKPEEPTGLGAVVEDADGERWIKIDEHVGCNDWVDLGAHPYKPSDENETVRHWYRDIAAVRVLSEGVTA